MNIKLTLPTDSEDRKKYPLYDACFAYFPAALAGVAKHSAEGNAQHNPGEPIHHARGKSADHGNCILRHLTDLGDILRAARRNREIGLADWYTVAILNEANAIAWRALALSQELHETFGGAPLAPAARLPEDDACDIEAAQAVEGDACDIYGCPCIHGGPCVMEHGYPDEGNASEVDAEGDAFAEAVEFLKSPLSYRMGVRDGLAGADELLSVLCRMLVVARDHMTACDRVMGDTHPCTCGADEARELLERIGGEPRRGKSAPERRPRRCMFCHGRGCAGCAEPFPARQGWPSPRCARCRRQTCTCAK